MSLTMGADGRAVANFILDYCDLKNRSVTQLSLQKITYFCHVWTLIKLKRPLVRHSFEAWEFGPVLPYLYQDFKNFEKSPITTRSKSLDPITGKRHTTTYEFDSQLAAILLDVIDFYSQLTAADLVRMSHMSGGPWDLVWNHSGKINPGMRINNDDITNYYSRVSMPFSSDYGLLQ